MRGRSGYHRLAAATAVVLVIGSAAGVRAGQLEGRGGPGGGGPGAGVRGGPSGPAGSSPVVVLVPGTPTPGSAFDIGYREGTARGQQDRRGARAFNYDTDRVYRSADIGYDQRLGTRDAFRSEFRRGFAAGYRTGYGRATVKGRLNDRAPSHRVPPGYQEPAVKRGYAEGYDKGRDDGQDHERYDPVRHSDYREADQGFKSEYGSKDAYRNNYRAGFRQGYEDGYRDGVRKKP